MPRLPTGSPARSFRLLLTLIFVASLAVPPSAVLAGNGNGNGGNGNGNGNGGNSGGGAPWADMGKAAWVAGGSTVQDPAARSVRLPTMRALRLAREDFLTRPSSPQDAETLRSSMDSLVGTVPSGDIGLDAMVLAEAEATSTALHVMGYPALAQGLLESIASRYTTLSSSVGGHPILDLLAVGAGQKATLAGSGSAP